ncbi:hypothetical protein Egran_00655 [Elaphomyces granulatus]|uniref:Zn(2)-C6 fungal-type domain-containing protein n=1 Tax=Elaphomyces granulatus TaxID=519963 RepID=A0A232M664_9EURO|nr:hypothetical protein Egran_00655 [Elaphomyces granulatus]
MQSLLLPPPSVSHPQLGQSRFNIDSGRLLNLWLPTNGPRFGLRASFSSLHMSGPPPVEKPTERSQEARPRTPTSRATATDGISAPIVAPVPLVSGTQEGRSVTSVRTQGPLLSSDGTQELFTTSSQPAGLAATVSTAAETTYLPTSAGVGTRTLPPRSTRRAKAHVASACVNCKRKHLGCDPARPCRRCVLAGKANYEATCVDVTHKKRGRPPLKAEEAPLRPYPAVEGPATPRVSLPATSSGRSPAHARTSSREIRPITDLQFARSREYMPGLGGSGLDSPAGHPQRWPLAFPSPPQGSPTARPTHGNLGQRPFSSPVPLHQSGPAYQQNPYTYPAGGAYATPGAYSSPPDTTRQYLDPSHLHSPTVSPQYQQSFPVALSSYVEGSQSQTRPPAQERSVVSRESSDPYPKPPLLLPPLRPREFSHAPPGHRRSDSHPFPAALSQWRRQEQDREFRQYEPSHSHELSEPSSSQPDTRSPPSVSRPSHVLEQDRATMTSHARQQQQSLLGTQLGIRRGRRDDDDENEQPTKRRRMALDDMVND